jgi:hypothetical protein
MASGLAEFVKKKLLLLGSGGNEGRRFLGARCRCLRYQISRYLEAFKCARLMRPD